MVKGKGKQICMILALIGLLTGCGSQSKVPDDYATNEGYQTEKADAKADTETNTADTIFSQASMWTATDSAYPIPPKEAAIPTRMILAFRECRKISGCPPIRLCARS